MKALLKKYLPYSALDRLRMVREYFLLKRFRPFTASHNYGGFPLKVRMTDPVSASWYDHDWEELPEFVLLKSLKLREGATVFDLGAHQCVVALQLAKIVGDSGKTVALEPGLRNYEVALENKHLNDATNLIIERAAIGNLDGGTTFSDTINGRVAHSGKSVNCLTVDTLVQKYGMPDVIFVDVEGYECKVLEGAGSALQSDIDWYVEVHVKCGLENYGGSAAKVVDTFRSAGYSLYYQTDPSFREPFLPATEVVPPDRFFLVASKAVPAQFVKTGSPMAPSLTR